MQNKSQAVEFINVKHKKCDIYCVLILNVK